MITDRNKDFDALVVETHKKSVLVQDYFDCKTDGFYPQKILSPGIELPFSPIKTERLNTELITFIDFIKNTPFMHHEGETMESIEVGTLDKDIDFYSKGTLVFQRKTNISTIIFILKNYILNYETNSLDEPHSKNITAQPLLSNDKLYTEASLLALEANVDVGGIFDTALSIAGDLGWATPYGPFITAGISLFKALFGPFGEHKDSTADAIVKVGKMVVEQVTSWEEQHELKKEIAAIDDFVVWLQESKSLLDTQNPETIKLHLTEKSGILEQINEQTSPHQYKLHSLITYLMEDSDFAKDGDAYKNRHHYLIAQNKLEILCYAMTVYIVALKTKIALLGTLYDLGYDENGQPTDKKNPDNTYKLVDQKIKDFSENIPKLASALKSRRVKMVSAPVQADCRVGRGRWGWAESSYNDWQKKSRQIRNEGFWWFLHDSLKAEYLAWPVKDESENPSPDEYETIIITLEHGVTHDTRKIKYHNWKRAQFFDPGRKKDGDKPISFVLNDGISCWAEKWDGYTPYNAEIKRRREVYIKSLDKEFKNWETITDKFKEGFDLWKQTINPQLPGSLEPIFIKEWKKKSTGEDIWAQKGIEVRYRFSFSNYGKESSLSNDHTSVHWTYTEGKKAPQIYGIPNTGDYLEFVSAICIYRQFRKDDKLLTERRIKKLKRDKEGNFPDHFIDQYTTQYDERELTQ